MDTTAYVLLTFLLITGRHSNSRCLRAEEACNVPHPILLFVFQRPTPPTLYFHGRSPPFLHYTLVVKAIGSLIYDTEFLGNENQYVLRSET
jgi:hypothetical protein